MCRRRGGGVLVFMPSCWRILWLSWLANPGSAPRSPARSVSVRLPFSFLRDSQPWECSRRVWWSGARRGGVAGLRGLQKGFSLLQERFYLLL